MLKISYVACPCLSQLISAQFALEMCLAARNHQKIRKNPYFGVQGHPADGEDLVILACTVFDWSTRATDKQTDGRTELRWLRRAKAVAAFARKSHKKIRNGSYARDMHIGQYVTCATHLICFSRFLEPNQTSVKTVRSIVRILRKIVEQVLWLQHTRRPMRKNRP